MNNKGFVSVPPNSEDEFEEDQTPRIVFGYIEHLIQDLVINEDKKGGSFTAIGLQAFGHDPMNPWTLLPEDRLINITHQSGTSDSECQFQYLS